MKSDLLTPEHSDNGAGGTSVEPIAIVGMGCRFPGASTLTEYWDVLREGRETIREIPPERWDVDRYYDPHPGTPGKMCMRRGGFLENVDQFDPYFFGVSPREAIYQDPQQRLLLEVAWEAIEDAGILPDELHNSHGGMFLCVGRVGAAAAQQGNLYGLNVYMATGDPNSTAGRLCWVLGLDGPATMVEAACSSSLVTVHLACTALRNGECELAFAGGANIFLQPEGHIMLSQAGMLSPEGRCKAFDVEANGFVRSEGVGVVLLKTLSKALADGDRIHALIRASAMTNDGSHSSSMAPSVRGQELALRRAYALAGISPAEVQYVEAHGTGTPVGDPIEIEALSRVLGEGRPKDRPCLVASSKTNIGHTESAAGAAGLIKTVLSLKHGMIPPSLNCHTLTPSIPWNDIPIVVQRELTSWPKNGAAARAGVNSFGVTGTNVHVVVEEAPPRPTAPVQPRSAPGAAQLLTLSARMPDTLKAIAGQYRTLLDQPGDEAAPDLADICYTAGMRRAHYAHRLAVVGHTRQELNERLAAYIGGEERLGLWHGQRSVEEPRKPVFIFSGAGSQWIGMGRKLRDEEPCFRDVLERCDEGVRRHLGWSVLEQIDAPEESSDLNRLDVTQAVLFSMQVALAALWRSWGVEPSVVVGHSLGEYAAAHVSGALSLDDALRAMCARSKLIEKIVGCGRMLAVGLGSEESRAAISGKEDLVSIGVLGSPISTVLSGDAEELERVKEQLDAQDVFARWVATDVASHSHMVETITGELAEMLQDLEGRPETIPIYSTVTGGPLAGTEFGGAYWVRNLRETVQFGPVIENLLSDGYTSFIEVSPHPLLKVPVQQCASHVGRTAVALPTMRRDEDDRAVPLESLGALHTMGHPVDWKKLFPEGRVVSLPHYPWPRERFWATDSSPREGTLVASDHPFLRYRWESASHPGAYHWEIELDSKSFPYVAEHRYQGVPIYPGAGFLELALAAVQEIYGEGPCVFQDVQFVKALAFREDDVKRLQLIVAPDRSDRPGLVNFKLYDRDGSSANTAASWTLLASGLLDTAPEEGEASSVDDFSAETLDATSLVKLETAEFYERVSTTAAQMGPTFQGVREAWFYGHQEKAVFRIKVPDDALRQAAGHPIHPGFLDTILHMYWIFRILNIRQPHVLPTGIRRLEIHELPDPEVELWARCWLVVTDPEAGIAEGHVEVFDQQGKVYIREAGHISKPIENDGPGGEGRDFHQWLYTIGWEEQPLPAIAAEADPGAVLIVADRGGLGNGLESDFESRGVPFRLIEPKGDEPWQIADFESVIEELRAAAPGVCQVLYLAALDAPPNAAITSENLEAEPKRICEGALHLLQALGKQAWDTPCRLWYVTRGAQVPKDRDEEASLLQAPLLGLGRVAATEYPGFHITRLDLDPAQPPSDTESILCEILAQGEHQVVAWRQGQRYTARMARWDQEDTAIRKTITASDEGNDSYRLETSDVGILDNLTLQHCSRQPPGPGEVEVRITFAGLNFLDVLRSLAMYPGPQPKPLRFGMEAAGRVVACGEGVRHVKVGDDVIVMGAEFSGLFQCYVTTNAGFVFSKPEHLSHEEAATIPVVYQTAYYSLVHLARLQKGESVLIHSAAGGVGMAALELARQIGAEVFATAGSDGKREYLKSLGVRHVMNSRTLDFAEEILEKTQGQGVDVVLNSLAGDAIPKSLSVLGTGGRFVEIGKRDIYENTQLGLLPFQKNLSFFAVDLMRMSQERPEAMSSLSAELIEKIQDGTFKPLPYKVFPISQAPDAFRYMAQAQHMGKVLLDLTTPEVEVEVPAGASMQMCADATYLITGGLGGLGLVFARWLVERGARHLVLMGRRGATPESQPAIDDMQDMGAEVRAVAADVGRSEDVARVVAEIRESMPPLKGVIHGAGVLNDALIESLEWPAFEDVFAPKVAGGWNLQTHLGEEDLDFFVMCSSAAALIGGPGQGNYAAANSFIDALAFHRRSKGLSAITINWGPWAEVGLAAELARAGKLPDIQGVLSIRPAEGIKILDYGLTRNDAQVMAMPIDWRGWTEEGPGTQDYSVVSPLGRESLEHTSQETDTALLDAIRKAQNQEEARQIIEEFLSGQISAVLKVSKDRIERQTGIDRLGLDSLMAMELKVRIESTLPVTLPVVQLLQGPTLIELSESLRSDVASRSDRRAGSPPTAKVAPATPLDQTPVDVDELSDKEVDTLLAEVAAEQGATDG